MEEEDHFTQTQLPALTHYFTWQQGCCPWQPLTLSLWSLTFCTLCSFCSHSWCPFIGSNGATSSYSSSTKVAANSSSSSTMVAANSQWLVPSICCTYNGNKPNNHPLCHSCGATVLLLLQHRLTSCISSKLIILRASPAKFTGTRQTFQSPESPKHTFSHTKGSLQPDGLPLHIRRVLTLVSGTQHSPSSVSTMLGPEWFIKPYTKAYNTPSNGNFYFQVQQSLSEYLNMITSSPLFQESTHPEVAPALCSTLGTTPYFFVSLSLLVSRVQVAFHLHLWGQPIKGWSIYVLILWVLQCLHWAHHLDKSQLVPRATHALCSFIAAAS
jgi:hypothetical protein